jgi:hypothetical protein
MPQMPRINIGHAISMSPTSLPWASSMSRILGLPISAGVAEDSSYLGHQFAQCSVGVYGYVYRVNNPPGIC